MQKRQEECFGYIRRQQPSELGSPRTRMSSTMMLLPPSTNPNSRRYRDVNASCRRSHYACQPPASSGQHPALAQARRSARACAPCIQRLARASELTQVQTHTRAQKRRSTPGRARPPRAREARSAPAREWRVTCLKVAGAIVGDHQRAVRAGVPRATLALKTNAAGQTDADATGRVHGPRQAGVLVHWYVCTC